MPIKGLSEQRRIPRVGKIHLGVKKKSQSSGKEYPSATEYFVVPPEVAAVHGEHPTELPIMIPVEDEEFWASQYYRAYSQTRGLTCKGDGDNCRRMIDVKTGAMANRDTTGKVEWKEMPCDGKECVHYQQEKCREVMNLQFLLPQVPGLGVWQIDTSSINSIRNINSSAELIRGIIGRIRMVPLILSLGKLEVVNPDDGKKKVVNVMSLSHGATLQNLIADSIKPIMELLAPPPDDETEPPLDLEIAPSTEEQKEQAEQDIKKLWPEDNKSEAKAAAEIDAKIMAIPEEEKADPKDHSPVTAEHLKAIQTLLLANRMGGTDLQKWCNADPRNWGIEVSTALEVWQHDIIIEAFKKGEA